MFNSTAGIKMVHIPYRGDAPMVTALIGGDIQLAFLPQANGIANVQSNLHPRARRHRHQAHDRAAERAHRAGAGLQGPGGRKLERDVRAGRHAAGHRHAIQQALAKALADPEGARER